MTEAQTKKSKSVIVIWKGNDYLLTFDDPKHPDIIRGMYTKFPNPYPDVFGKTLKQAMEEFEMALEDKEN